MPDSSRLEHYKRTIDGGGGGGAGDEGPTPPSSDKRSTNVLNAGISRGGLFIRRSAKEQREASYKRLMKARAETRARKSVKDERIIKSIRDIPVEWHGTETLIEPTADGPAAWHKSLAMIGGGAGNSKQNNDKHYSSSHGNGHHGHHQQQKKKVHAVKKIKTAFERHLDALERNCIE